MANYVHALKYKFLNRLYDPLMAATTNEKALRTNLIESMEIVGNEKVLDLGCGTGSFLIELKKQYPNIDAWGIDGDPSILEISEKKAVEQSLNINFQNSVTESLPFKEDEFDIVVSSLVFHHLTEKQKMASLREAYRVLKSERGIHILDWSKPTNKLMDLAFYSVQMLDGFKTTGGVRSGELIVMMTISGFKECNTHDPINTVFGTIAIHSGKK